MGRTGEVRNRRLMRSRCTLKALKRMKAKVAAKKAEICRLREATAEIVTAMEEMKSEQDPLKMSLHQHSDDMILISEAVDGVTQIILQL